MASASRLPRDRSLASQQQLSSPTIKHHRNYAGSEVEVVIKKLANVPNVVGCVDGTQIPTT